MGAFTATEWDIDMTAPSAQGLDDTTFAATTTANAPLPQLYVPPLRGAAPGGLWYSVPWVEDDGAHWSVAGKLFRSSVTGNYAGELASGVWNADWCGEPGSGDPQLKTGVRADDPEAFLPITTWAFDSCDLTEASRAEVQSRVQQIFRVREPLMVAREFAYRLLADAGAATAVTDLVDAVAEVESVFADHNATGVVHVSPRLLTHLAAALVVSRSGGGWVTPSGHTVIADGGYAPVLGDTTLVLTSAVYGWRSAVQVRQIPVPEENRTVAIAERTVLLGYEEPLGSIEVTP